MRPWVSWVPSSLLGGKGDGVFLILPVTESVPPEPDNGGMKNAASSHIPGSIALLIGQGQMRITSRKADDVRLPDALCTDRSVGITRSGKAAIRRDLTPSTRSRDACFGSRAMDNHIGYIVKRKNPFLPFAR